MKDSVIVGITVIGQDRGGIVAAFTNFVFFRGGNINKINQNVYNGLFGMYLEISFTRDVDIEEFDKSIQNMATQENMEVNTHHMTDKKRKNIAICVTKEPHCLEAILENSESLSGNIDVIIATQDTLAPIAAKANIPFITIEDKNQQKAEEKILKICKEYNIHLIVLARYMRILTPNFVWRYPNRIINIHPSLLPAFQGASAYAQAFERGTKIAGVTCHYVTENLDQGPIILQDIFQVEPNDSIENIKSKGQKLEATTLLKAVKLHLEDKLEVRWRKVHVKKLQSQ